MKNVALTFLFLLAVCLAVFHFTTNPPPTPSDVPIIIAADKAEVAKKTVKESKKQVKRAEAITAQKKADAIDAVKIYDTVIETPTSTDTEKLAACDNALITSTEEVNALQFENDSLKAEIVDHETLEAAMTEHGDAVMAQNTELKNDNADLRGKLEFARYGLIVLGVVAGGMSLYLLLF